MGQFNEAIPFTLTWESGYAKVKGDAGEETYRGISRKWFPHWEGWPLVDMHKPLKRYQIIKDTILEQMVETFYYKTFWVPVQADKIVNQTICKMLLDWNVTSGDDSVKHLQKIAGVTPDGDLGAKSLAAINKMCIEKPAELIARYKQERIDFYTHLATIGDNAQFLEGWLNRVNSIC